MSSNVAYGEALPASAASDVEPARDVELDGDRGKDWPLALTVFVPVLVAYAGVVYGAYAIARTVL